MDFPQEPPPIPSPAPSNVPPPTPQARAKEKFKLAMTGLRLAEKYPGSPFKRHAMELLAESMSLDPEFLDAPLMLGMTFFQSHPVKYAVPIVERATKAYPIDRHHREALVFLAQVLEIPESVSHFGTRSRFV